MSHTRLLSQRRAGVLLAASSLRQGANGALGAPAHRFIDWLADAGFSMWQVLPLVPVDHCGSPYWARSDRAGNTDLLDPQQPDTGNDDDFEAWRTREAHWLHDYLLFEALAAEQGGAPWWSWPAPLRTRDADALHAAAHRLDKPMRQRARAQWRFDMQWRALRDHARARSVHIMGDLPLYVAPDSVATWTSPEQFQLNAAGRSTAVAGVPPDYFAVDGQLWGNPLYNWDAHVSDGFSFWLRRLALQSERFELLRVDHFRALEAYWAVPALARTAREGEWRKAPGNALLATVAAQLPALELVAEDLGVITPEVTALRRAFGLPGMRVLQFGFDGDPANLHLPHMHDTDSIVYTGTHDNDTTAGWYAGLTVETRDLVRRYLGRADADIVAAMVRAALGSVGCLAVLPAQDLLHLGGEARLNRPGTVTGNWSWCLPLESLTDGLAARYRDLVNLHNRSPSG